MPCDLGIGFSRETDSMTAAQQAVKQAKKKIGEGPIDLVLVLHTPQYVPKEFLSYLCDSVDRTRIIGCSTTALILSEGMEQRGIAVMALRSDNIRFEIGHMSHLHFQNIVEAGQKMAADCITGFGTQFRKMFLYFVNGMNPSLPALIQGFKDQLGPAFPIYGAGSSDDLSFKKSYQIYQDKCFSDGATGVILGGSPRSGISIKHGFHPLGKPRTIDAVDEKDNHIIRTIDGKPAVHLFSEYFEHEAASLANYRLGMLNVRYPLGIIPPDEKEYLIRNVTNILDDGSIVCQDNIVAGSRVHLMLGGKESCLEATKEAAMEVKAQLTGKEPEFILVFESLLRYQLLKRTLKEELAIIKKVLGEQVPLFGMFSMNEIHTPRRYFQETATTSIQNGAVMLLAIH